MINSVLNSLDRLEVRGRDSAGISLMFVLDGSEYEKFQDALSAAKKSDTLLTQFNQRIGKDVLLNRDISYASKQQTAFRPSSNRTHLHL
jgi:glutamine---fructose-6-phosphate transaminase (isomerizing)